MTFTDMVNEVTDRCNLTSTQAIARVGRSINLRYRQISSAVGTGNVTAINTVTVTTTPGNRFVVIPVKKLFNVVNNAINPPMPLNEIDKDTMRNMLVIGDPAQNYAIWTMGANTVTVLLDSQVSTAFTLTCDGEVSVLALAGTMVPTFHEDFHDLLIYWAQAVEYEKMGKKQDAKDKYAESDDRLEKLRYEIAKSAYLDITPGVRAPENINTSLPIIGQ